jgi:2-dehydro-3-deoxyphosphogluconate aldolase/(4S)-4-hydroxy-2-oxoglutarate aldolase
MKPALLEALSATGVVPVITIDRVEDAVPLAQALACGGVRAAEITFRTAAAAESIRRIAAEVPEVLVGAGTLLNPEQVEAAKSAGAAFAVAPGCTPATIKAAQAVDLPFAPGVMTPSDVERALELGCTILKFFPAESAGGLDHLKSLYAPYQAAGVRFIPTGGIDVAKARAYLAFKGVVAVGGSWLTKGLSQTPADFAAIEQAARDAAAMVQAVRAGS